MSEATVSSLSLRELSTKEDLEKAYLVLKELRISLSFQDFIATYDAARNADAYTIVGAMKDKSPIAIMGYRILFDFVHGKHLYVDDLVTSSSQRSKGIGAELLRYAETEAIRLGCHGLRLCTGIANEAGRRFYEREKWEMRSVVYKKKVAEFTNLSRACEAKSHN